MSENQSENQGEEEGETYSPVLYGDGTLNGTEVKDGTGRVFTNVVHLEMKVIVTDEKGTQAPCWQVTFLNPPFVITNQKLSG